MNVLTLENYCERYLPLVTLKTVTQLMTKVMPADQLYKLAKQSDNMHVALSLAITQDQGKGSIFTHIADINQYLSERLFCKIDLTRET
jgi:hypothetical protein